jgi:pyruvate/2-oxoacid:ferredoxin oxidoreductase beta subunit
VNSTRVIWMQVKGYVDRHNISFTVKEIRYLLQTAAENKGKKMVKLYTPCNENEGSFCETGGRNDKVVLWVVSTVPVAMFVC